MSDDLSKYAQQLRHLVDEYYHQQITLDDYRAQRKLIFDHIEMDLAGSHGGGEAQAADALKESTSPS